MHLNPNNDDVTLSDKLASDIGRNSLNQTKLELHWKKILSSASDALYTIPNQPMILPPTTIQDTQQWTNVTPQPHTRKPYNNLKSKQHIAVSLHPTQQGLPASMAQPTPESTKGQSSNGRKSSPFFNTPGANTVLFSPKGAETTRARVIPVNQPRPMSKKNQPSDSCLQPNHCWTTISTSTSVSVYKEQEQQKEV